jgi:hypothetical protein
MGLCQMTNVFGLKDFVTDLNPPDLRVFPLGLAFIAVTSDRIGAGKQWFVKIAGFYTHALITDHHGLTNILPIDY